MSLNDTLANAMVSIKNSEMVGHGNCIIKPGSRLIREVLTVMKNSNYIGDFEEINDGRGIVYKIKLLGKINKCRAIKPRYAVKRNEFEKWEKDFLPARNTGLLIVTTPEGVMSVNTAKEKKLGGRLLAFVY